MSRKRKRPHPCSPPAPRIAELMQRGWCRRDADHLGVIELALATVMDLPLPGRRVLAVHVSTALHWEPVELAAFELYAEPEHGPAWRALSAAAASPFDDVVARIAVRCEGMDIVSMGESDTGLVLHPDNLHHVREAERAEARGDFQAALVHLSQSVRPLKDTWRAELEYLACQGDGLSPAAWGSRICQAAVRWALGTELGLETAATLGALVLTTLGAPKDLIEREVPRRMASDQLLHDALLFDAGALDAYLEQELARHEGPGPRLALVGPCPANGLRVADG